MKRIRYLLLVAASFTALTLLFTGLIVAARAVGRASESELLVYRNDPTHLYEFDLNHRLSRMLIENEDLRLFSYGGNGRLAFTAYHKGSFEIFILDVYAINTTISHSISTENARYYYPLAWSPDGRYLAFSAEMSQGIEHLYLWDGVRTINITPQHLEVAVQEYSVAWSNDGRLAFAVWHGFSVDLPPQEIYLWDGNTTTNLSQNPHGVDLYPVWSMDGHLAFLSEREGGFDILIWDGCSIKNGLPDADTFINVQPELTNHSTTFVWTPDGRLAFRGSDVSGNAVIYLWDGQSATDISQNPNASSINPIWSPEGRWGFVGSSIYLYIRDGGNSPVATLPYVQYGQGPSPPVWSSNGALMYCAYGDGWTLSIWDGTNRIKVVEGDYINAQWANGAIVVCASA